MPVPSEPLVVSLLNRATILTSPESAVGPGVCKWNLTSGSNMKTIQRIVLSGEIKADSSASLHQPGQVRPLNDAFVPGMIRHKIRPQNRQGCRQSARRMRALLSAEQRALSSRSTEGIYSCVALAADPMLVEPKSL